MEQESRTFKVNADIAKLRDAGVQRQSDVVILIGLVASVDKNSVTIQRGLFSQNQYVVPIKSILHSSEADQGDVTLMVDPSTPIVIHTIAETFVVALDDNPNPSDRETKLKECKTKARDKCIEDAKVLGASQEGAEKGCDQFLVKHLRDQKCENSTALVGSTYGQLGAEIVLASRT